MFLPKDKIGSVASWKDNELVKDACRFSIDFEATLE
jgi:hypothetical protein